MRINGPGLAILKFYESCRLKAYQDSGGVWTIGWGHTGGVKPGQKITQQEADDLLVKDLQRFEKGVTALLPNPVSLNQFSALVCFAYNVGLDAFADSTMRKKLAKGDDAGAANEFGRWVKDNGVTLRGLVKRRAAEKALFLTA